MLTAGVDVGSSSVKTVVMDERASRPAVLAKVAERIRRRDLRQVIRICFDSALAEARVEEQDLAYIATTGEGELVEFRRGHFFGMTTHARGGLFLEPEARAVLDMGALHARAIRMDERSRVLGYRMTSQCASGSGQFLENIARYLGVALEEVGTLSREGKSPEQISGICAVLAETDVINMVSRGIDVRDILKGIHMSMAGRFVRLIAATGAKGVVATTGGLAADAGLLAVLREEAVRQKLDVEIRAPQDGIFAGALGAALWGAFRAARLRGEAMGSTATTARPRAC
jgi:benzoyl-CoA reductase subunit D